MRTMIDSSYGWNVVVVQEINHTFRLHLNLRRFRIWENIKPCSAQFSTHKLKSCPHNKNNVKNRQIDLPCWYFPFTPPNEKVLARCPVTCRHKSPGTIHQCLGLRMRSTVKMPWRNSKQLDAALAENQNSITCLAQLVRQAGVVHLFPCLIWVTGDEHFFSGPIDTLTRVTCWDRF